MDPEQRVLLTLPTERRDVDPEQRAEEQAGNTIYRQMRRMDPEKRAKSRLLTLPTERRDVWTLNSVLKNKLGTLPTDK